MSEWKTYKLGDICSDISYGYTESASSETIGPKYLRITDIQHDFINWVNVPYCPITQTNHRKYKLETGDIVIARTGASTGTTAIFKDTNIDAVFASYLIRYKVDKTKANPFYIGHILRSPYWKNYVTSIIGGSAQPGANAKQFADFEFRLPDLPTQTQIAEILTTLDDKIELNLQMNQTLEAMAQAIFKEWFVDFKFPGFDGELVDGLPKGWKKEPLDEKISFLNGLALQKFPPKNETDYLPVIKIRELKQGISESSDKASTDIDKKYIIEDGDILFSWSGSLEVVMWCNGKGALNQHLFKVSSEKYPKWFYYYWTKEFLPIFQATAADKATTMGHIQRRHLTESLINVPDKSLMKLANDILEPLLERIKSNAIQIQTLIQTRDNLLPRLMSGKIEVN